ncbi:hypothetical protein [Saccharothrix syringae]|uniref:hypothetical protein n=1 Tax=Saccharothrix syringae TaxID=103733 RepID=UPI00068C2599|nr:hypothetical protein [Saccharothrix syringae]
MTATPSRFDRTGRHRATSTRAVDLASGDVEVVVPVDGPVRSPDDLAFGADGSMYVTDLVPGQVRRRDPAGGYAWCPTGCGCPTASPAWATGCSSTR